MREVNPGCRSAVVAPLSATDGGAPAGAQRPAATSHRRVGTAVHRLSPAALFMATSAHDQRVRGLGFLTVVLVVVAVGQTVYLRRRKPVPVQTGPNRNRPAAGPGSKAGSTRTTPGPGPAPWTGATARPGAGKSATAKTGPSKSTRAPKSRGGPKGGGSKGPNPKVPSSRQAVVTPDAERSTDVDAPTVVVPPPPSARTPRHEPAIAQLLAEDAWRPEPAAPKPAPPGLWERLADDRSGEVQAVVIDTQDVVASPGFGPSTFEAAVTDLPVIPPVPAEDLSFWDLFPEDLPPARVGSVQVDELVAEVPPPSEAIVLAELLDGPAPTPQVENAEAAWSADRPGDEIVLSELLEIPPAIEGSDTGDADDDEDGIAPAARSSRQTPEERARIAADRARRRRNRRSGRRPRPNPGSSGPPPG